MNYRWVLVAAAAPLLVGCGGSSDGGSQIVSGRETGPYTSPTQIITKLNEGGVNCRPDGKSFSTLYSLRSQHCLVGRKLVTVAIYSNDDQLAAAKRSLPAVDPNAVIVFGDQWSVDVADEALAHQIQSALD